MTAIIVCAVILGAVLTWIVVRSGIFNTKQPSPSSASQSDIAVMQADLDTVVANYRKIIVLLEDERSLNPGQLARADLIGQDLFYKNQKLLGDLTDKLTSETGGTGHASSTAPPQGTTHFLDRLENLPDWHDADRLVFFEMVEELIETAGKLPETFSGKADLLRRLEDDLKALKQIRSLYNKELDKIFGRFDMRGIVVRREAWERYVAYLKTKFTREDIFKEYSSMIPEDTATLWTGERGPAAARGEFQPKQLVLTFDDGPHHRYTPRIMEILQDNGVKAVFFEVGCNIGSIKADNTIQRSKVSRISEELVKSGFFLANHSYSHAFLPKLNEKDLAREIGETSRLLESIAGKPTTLFRPPYGAQNETVLAAVDAHHMRSLLWHVDSKDWADPIPKSIADRVVREVNRSKRGVILFHDINSRTVEALPVIIEALRKDGYQFLSWDGKTFFAENKRGNETPSAPQQAPELYRESWAVIIGIDKYRQWPKLRYAVNDAKGVRELLIRRYRFKPENIIMLLDEDATRDRILSTLGDVMGNTDKVKKDDRVFVFFAGHGVTKRLPSGRELGYIVPVDADSQNYQGKSISMTNFQDISETIPAKHLFFVMDSCYSGLALMRGSGIANSGNYLREVSRRVSRQMLTAGGADQQVADTGPNGHSIFTWSFLQGLEGRADLNNDGFITASELAAYIGPTVSTLSKQTPAFGSLAGSEGGEFIFDPKGDTEFLSELSAQLDQEAIRINDQLEQIRKQIAEKRLRNKKLRKELNLAMTDAGTVDPSMKTRADQSITFAKHIERGDALFKEQKYNEALKEFLDAARMVPSNPLAANNVGYIYFKTGQYKEAVQWFEKTIALDPSRAVAYGNLGEAYFNFNKKAEAKKAFIKYLELAPDSKYAAEIRNKLATLD